MTSTSNAIAAAMIEAARDLSSALDGLRFSAPVTHVYNPLDYAWPVHETYLQRYGNSRKRVVFFGMNPGPFGMVQTGVPFGEIHAVRDWMGLTGTIGKPAHENPKRPILGFDCKRSEVSGQRLWGLFQQRFGSPDNFFSEHFVANYCPLAFFDGGRNVTPDKLPAQEARPLLQACDRHLQRVAEILQPQWVIGVGAWAEKRAEVALADLSSLKIGRVLHPSPASPVANRGWAEAATRQLVELGVWEP